MKRFGGRASPPNYFWEQPFGRWKINLKNARSAGFMEANFVKEIIDAVLAGHPELFLVDWSLSADNDIRVIIDADRGVDMESVIAVSRAIEHHEAMDRDREDFSISVSSPGADAPLRLPRQYVKHVGRTLKVTCHDGSEVSGELTACDADRITLQWTMREPKPVGKGKHNVTHTLDIPYGDIKKAVVVIKF